MEIESIEQADLLHKKSLNLLQKIKSNQQLSKEEHQDLIQILSLASYELSEISQEK